MKWQNGALLSSSSSSAKQKRRGCASNNWKPRASSSGTRPGMLDARRRRNKGEKIRGVFRIFHALPQGVRQRKTVSARKRKKHGENSSNRNTCEGSSKR